MSVLGSVLQQQCRVAITEEGASHVDREVESHAATARHRKPALRRGGLGDGDESPRSRHRGRYSSLTKPEWDQDHTAGPQVLDEQLTLPIQINYEPTLLKRQSANKHFHL